MLLSHMVQFEMHLTVVSRPCSEAHCQEGTNEDEEDAAWQQQQQAQMGATLTATSLIVTPASSTLCKISSAPPCDNREARERRGLVSAPHVMLGWETEGFMVFPRSCSAETVRRREAPVGWVDA